MNPELNQATINSMIRLHNLGAPVITVLNKIANDNMRQYEDDMHIYDMLSGTVTMTKPTLPHLTPDIVDDYLKEIDVMVEGSLRAQPAF